MSPVGYSGTPLIKKLGIQSKMKVLLINEPCDYFELLETDISEQLIKKNDCPDLVHFFVMNKKEFEVEMKKLKSFCKKNPALAIWVSWYKKSALRQVQGKLKSDVTEDTIRNYALKNDLVDVKVCAVSEIWSGLKLVVPLAKR